MKGKTTLIKTVLVIVLGILFARFGLQLPQKQVEEVADGVLDEVATQIDQHRAKPQITQREDGVTELPTYKVVSVIDGDTLVVLKDGKRETVRVLGINTPETKYSHRGAECFGSEASVYARQLLENKEVTLTQDPSQDTRDKYNRLLAYVGLPDGRDFGQVMIADGYAYEYTYHGQAGKNQQQYKQAQKIAKDQKLGLWAEGVCEG